MSATTTRTAGELPGLTMLRGIAALTVFVAHARFHEFVAVLRPLTAFFEWHPLAVDLFFMLSGFVLMHVYQPRFEAGRPGFWRTYFQARFARIMPLHWVVMVIFMAAFGLLWLVQAKWPSHATSGAVLKNFALLQNWPLMFCPSINLPSWSLSVEIFCYVTAMPVMLLMSRVRMPVSFCALCVAFLLAWRITHELGMTGWPSLARGVVCFVAGCLVHRVKVLRHWRTGAVAALSFVVLRGTAAWGGGNAMLPMIACPFLILGFSAEVPQGAASRVLLWLGDVTYSLYLLQGPFLLFVDEFARPRLDGAGRVTNTVWIVFEITVMLGIASLSCRWIEKPARAWIRRTPVPSRT